MTEDTSIAVSVSNFGSQRL